LLYCTVRLAFAEVVAAPLVPVTAIVPVPMVAEVAAETVAVALAPGLTLDGLKVTVTPVGAVALSATAFVKPVLAVTATVKVVVLPCVTVSEVDDGVRVSVGATTLTVGAAVTEAEPLTPLIVMVSVAAAVVVEAETVAVALAPGLTLDGLKVTVTPVGAVAESETALVNPLVAATATVKVVDWPWKVLSELALGVTVNVGATTVTPALAVAVDEPLVPLIEMVPVPADAVVDAETVAVALAPGLTLAGLKVTVMPVGAVADRVTALVNPPVAATATVKVVDCPRNVLSEVALGVTVNVGTFTVTPVLAVAVDEPLVPLMEIVPVPAGAVVDAATVAVALAPGFTLAGLKDTVTPVGAVADSATALVNPLVAPTATVKVVD